MRGKQMTLIICPICGGAGRCTPQPLLPDVRRDPDGIDRVGSYASTVACHGCQGTGLLYQGTTANGQPYLSNYGSQMV